MSKWATREANDPRGPAPILDDAALSVIRGEVRLEELPSCSAGGVCPCHSGGDDATDYVVEISIPGGALRAVPRNCGWCDGARWIACPACDVLSTVRGRIRFDEQIRKRQGIFPPIEVRFDEFTEDIEENRLLKAAVDRLRHIRLRSSIMRRALTREAQVLLDVSDVEYNPRSLPDINFTRLNERYGHAIGLAKLILAARSWEQRRGGVQASAFLVDMNKVFEDFVVTALREALNVGAYEFAQGAARHNLFLDEANNVRLKPDISWWREDRCQFVGDLKYKRIAVPGIEHADLYQLLSYCVATQLPGGLLIYAKGEGQPVTHEVAHLGRRLQVIALDLEQSPEAVLAQVGSIADTIRRLRGEWRFSSGAA